MNYYAGLDVSVKETSICIVDETGKICREPKVPSHPEDPLRNFGLKVGVVCAAKFKQRIQELIDGLPDLSELIEILQEARRKLREQFTKLHRKLPSQGAMRRHALINRFLEAGHKGTLQNVNAFYLIYALFLK